MNASKAESTLKKTTLFVFANVKSKKDKWSTDPITTTATTATVTGSFGH